MYLSDIYTITASLAGIPGINVPCGFTDRGLPVGMQILASHFNEPATIAKDVECAGVDTECERAGRAQHPAMFLKEGFRLFERAGRHFRHG